jgi:hypothetical protein
MKTSVQIYFSKNIVGRCSSDSNLPIFIGCTMFILVNFSILGYVWVDRIGLVLDVCFWRIKNLDLGLQRTTFHQISKLV